MKPWKLIILLTGIFVAGGITGVFGTLRFRREMVIRRPPNPEQWVPNHLKSLAEKLTLNAEQTEQIRPIVKGNMEELKRLRTESMGRTKSIFERMEHEIAEKLTPEQRVKFDQLNKEWRERSKRAWPDRKGPPGGEPPPPGEAPPDKPPGGI